MNFDKETIEGCIRVAKGCFDYGGGYRDNKKDFEIYQHGIQTVVNSLEGLLNNGLSNLQVRMLHEHGKDK